MRCLRSHFSVADQSLKLLKRRLGGFGASGRLFFFGPGLIDPGRAEKDRAEEQSSSELRARHDSSPGALSEAGRTSQPVFCGHDE